MGTGPTAGGRVVFAASNPDFAPKQLYIYGILAIADPAAVSGVMNFYSTCWGWNNPINGTKTNITSKVKWLKNEIWYENKKKDTYHDDNVDK